MDMQMYRTIVTSIKKFKGLSKDCLQCLKDTYPSTNPDTLYSLVALEYQRRMRYKHIKTPEVVSKYWDAYHEALRNQERPGIILRLAEANEVCPCLAAKIVLQKFFEDIKEIDPQLQINDYLRDTTLIPDPDLAHEVFLCTIYDNLYGPISETLRHSLGQQYEIKLHNEVVKLGLAFRDEEHLRKFGYDKTPDVKLDVPVAIDGFIINWIESKALFGDEEVHREYTRNQYLSYWNRFGPGLVIYWFGFPKSIASVADKKFMIRDHLAQNIVTLNYS